MRSPLFYLLFVFSLPAAAFGPYAEKAAGCTSLAGGDINFNVDYNAQIWPIFFNNCTGCHTGGAPAGGLSLSDMENSIRFLVNQPGNRPSTNAFTLVVPGNPSTSFLLQKVNCSMPDAGSRMPLGGVLTSADQALMYDWIMQGAYGEDPMDPIVRDFVYRDGLESVRQ